MERSVAAIAGLGLLASLYFLVHPWYDPIRDATIYLSTAQSMAAGEGYSYLGIPYAARPPGFSFLLIAPLRGFGLDFHALNLFVSGFGALAVVLLYGLLRRRLGPLLALLVSGSVWFLPAYQTLCNRIMSDVPGLALLLACLLLERWASRCVSWRRELLLGVAIGLSALVRSMNILLVPAIVAARASGWLKGDTPRLPLASFAGRQGAFLVLGAVLTVAPWALRGEGVTPPSPVDQVTVYSYSTGMWHSDLGDPDSPRVTLAEVTGRIPPRSVQLVHALGSAMQLNASGNRPPDHPVAAAHAVSAGLLLLGLLYVLAKRREPAEFFAVAALVVIALYFSFQNRLVLPIYVIAFAATVEMARDVLRRVVSQRSAGIAVAAALGGLLLVNWAPRAGWDRIRERHRALERDAAAIADGVGPEDCLAASAGFHYGLYLGRPVYSLQMAVRRAGDIGAVEDVIDRYGITTLALFGDKKMEREILRYARRTYSRGETAGSGVLFRVRAPDVPCGSARSPGDRGER